MTRFAWLMRRELWEHRAIWMAPLVVLALLVVASVYGNVLVDDLTFETTAEEGRPALSEEDIARIRESGGLTDEQIEQLKSIRAGEAVPVEDAMALVPEQKKASIATVSYVALSVLMYFVLGVIGFFYALDALYSDRRDRSILFWKSLPLSDTETVLAKFAVAVILIPLVAVAAGIAGQLIVAAGASAKLAAAGSAVGFLWSGSTLGAGVAATLLIGLAVAMWYAPLVGYLLLASAWAPKSPFLWAVLPPVALSILEKIVWGTGHVTAFISMRLLGPFKALARDDSTAPAVIIDGDKVDLTIGAAAYAENIARFFVSPGMLLGLVAAALLVAAAIWVRRYRDETM